jgi:hypothetical protein
VARAARRIAADTKLRYILSVDIKFSFDFKIIYAELTPVEELLMISMAPRPVSFGVRSRKLSNIGQSLEQKFIVSSSSVLQSWLHLQSLASINPHWVRVVAYVPFYMKSIRKACAPEVGALIG